jgi:uncharacterized protein DUF4244
VLVEATSHGSLVLGGRRLKGTFTMSDKIADSLVSRPAARDERGMNTAEYAVGTVGACGFAGILYQILTSNWGQSMLQGIFSKVTDLLPF